MAKAAAKREAAVKIRFPATETGIARAAARELAQALSAIFGVQVQRREDAGLESRVILVEQASARAARPGGASALSGDSFEIARPAPDAIALRAGSERALLHAACNLLEGAGAKFAAGAPACYPRLGPGRLWKVEPYRIEPAFSRRAFVSDIMTWNYQFADRLELHLRFDREFIPWMARRGINAFQYVRDAHDARLRIDELVSLYRSWGIESEYGGHVLQILLARERFDTEPDLFPAGPNAVRNPRGNLCVSNPEALKTVCTGALALLRAYPENRMLHVWGADVAGGAWCSCPQCRTLSPQLQYMKVVNAIASAGEAVRSGVPVAYLAYHDTIDPDPRLRPRANVYLEWAPRERCYVHAIDDPSCAVNPRYFESLKGYLDLFQGRGVVFEYYGDAILFGGLGFATPAVIARDLSAYRALGVAGISCLTFGAYSVLAYPVNLEAFVRATRSPDLAPRRIAADTAAGRHPECAEAMGRAYRAIEKASALVLDYGDVMRPYRIPPSRTRAKLAQLARARRHVEAALKAEEHARESSKSELARAEEELWNYGLAVFAALGDYLRAREEHGAVRRTLGESAIANLAAAVKHIREIDLGTKGTWGAYDFERLRETWLDALRRNLE